MAKAFDPKAKARRQKIILAVLGVVLLAVMAYQAPTILGAFGGGSSAESTTQPAPPPAPTGPATPAPTAAAPAPAAANAALIDSDPALDPAAGQLVSFDRFESKDPFFQQVGDTTSTPSAAPRERPANRADQVDLAPVPDRPPAAPAPKPQAATISVNGAEEEVEVGAAFPEADPIFKLVSVTRRSAKIGIVGGSYAGGRPTITLKKGGKPITLMNTADGTTYVLRLIAVD